MNVEELISKLQEFDLQTEVKTSNPTGGLKDITDVDTYIERDTYDQDFDRVVVLIN